MTPPLTVYPLLPLIPDGARRALAGALRAGGPISVGLEFELGYYALGGLDVVSDAQEDGLIERAARLRGVEVPASTTGRRTTDPNPY